VYHASTPDGRSLAIKVFKTSILVFKDRDRYVSGDFRFRNGYGKNNPRKMVKTWAEKEMRNLIRMKTAGMNVRPSIVPQILLSCSTNKHLSISHTSHTSSDGQRKRTFLSSTLPRVTQHLDKSRLIFPGVRSARHGKRRAANAAYERPTRADGH